MSALLTELQTDPMALGYAALITAGNDGAIYALINDKSRFTKSGWVTVSAFNTWCALHNAEYINIQSLAANNASPFYAAANSLLRCLNGAVSDGAINLADTGVFGLFNSWPFVDTTGSAKSALIALGTFPASRADILSISATIPDIAHALGRG